MDLTADNELLNPTKQLVAAAVAKATTTTRGAYAAPHPLTNHQTRGTGALGALTRPLTINMHDQMLPARQEHVGAAPHFLTNQVQAVNLRAVQTGGLPHTFNLNVQGVPAATIDEPPKRYTWPKEKLDALSEYAGTNLGKRGNGTVSHQFLNGLPAILKPISMEQLNVGLGKLRKKAQEAQEAQQEVLEEVPHVAMVLQGTRDVPPPQTMQNTQGVLDQALEKALAPPKADNTKECQVGLLIFYSIPHVIHDHFIYLSLSPPSPKPICYRDSMKPRGPYSKKSCHLIQSSQIQRWQCSSSHPTTILYGVRALDTLCKMMGCSPLFSQGLAKLLRKAKISSREVFFRGWVKIGRSGPKEKAIGAMTTVIFIDGCSILKCMTGSRRQPWKRREILQVTPML